MPDAQQTTDCWRQRPPPEQSGTVADSMVSLAPLRTSNRLLLSAHSTNSQLPPWMIPTVGALASSCFREKVSSKHARFHFTRHSIGYCILFLSCVPTTVVAARARDCAGTSRGGARRLVPTNQAAPLSCQRSLAGRMRGVRRLGYASDAFSLAWPRRVHTPTSNSRIWRDNSLRRTRQ